MRELYLKMSMSVDGFVAGPDGELDWMFATADSESDAWEVGVIRNVSLHIMGSRTYADMVAWWPSSNDVFAPSMNDIPKAVFTTKGAESVRKKRPTQAIEDALAAMQSSDKRKREPDPKALKRWQEAYVASGPIEDEIAKLKREDGKPIIAHGGASFARSLLATGQVDKLCLLIHPIVLGKGLAIFTKIDKPLSLKLESSTSFPKGAIGQIYRLA